MAIGRNIRRLIQPLMLAVLIGSAAAYAAGRPVPELIPGAVKVDAVGLIKLANRISDLSIIDARIAEDRTQGYIEGSVSLPDVETNCTSLARIIPRKTSPVLFYCNGVRCGRSVKSVGTALRCGYHNVYWFRGGFEEWKKQGYAYLTE